MLHFIYWTKSQGETVYLLILGRNLFTSEGNLQGGLGSGPFMITPTRCCGNGYPHVRIWTFSAYLVEKNCGCEPLVKKLQPTCADRAVNPNLSVI